MKKLFIIFLILINTVYAQTGQGGDVGNGGHIVKCSDTAPILLDLWELDINSTFYTSDSGGYSFILYMARDRFYNIHRALYWKLFNIERRYRNSFRLTNLDLSNITTDYGDVQLPASCELEQVALLTNINTGRERLYIDKKRWKQLNEHNKAALILHEYLYKEAISNGFDKYDSTIIRKIVRAILTTELLNLNSPSPHQLEMLNILLKESKLIP